MVFNSAVSIAGVFGPFMVIMGLWMLLFSDNMVKIWGSLKSTPSVFFLMGLINLLFGLLILNGYSDWSWSKQTLVTLLGWCLVIRGIMALFLPQILVKYTMTNVKNAKVIGLIPLIWGVVLCWIAFA